MKPVRFDLAFRGVGRIRVSAGTHDAKVAEKMKAMMYQFYDSGRLDLLIALREKRITPLLLYNQVILRQSIRVPTAEEMEGLSGMADWADNQPNKDTRRSYLSNINMLIRFAGPDAQMGDIAHILRRYRATAAPVVWNRTAVAVRSYLSDRQRFVPPDGMLYHPLYANVAVLPMNEESPRAGRPFTVAELASLSPELGTFAGMAWTLALTGMRRGEYWSDWQIDGDRILVPGGKMRKEIRPVPYMGYAVKPLVSYQTFRKRFVKAAPGHIIHDLRRTFVAWADEADIPRIRRKLYVGHANSDLHDLYERRDISAFLVEDANKMKTYLGQHIPTNMVDRAATPYFAGALNA